ncbi:MAG: uracil-DNA glycosylase [Planctomycetota bacterium]|jgi:uracil-DNA glycosylase family 4
MARGPTSLDVLAERVVACRRCPELRRYCREVAAAPRRAFAEWRYWGRPVPSFGDQAAGLLIVGLAPGAHGANRTGRMFTGDRSGDFLYAALHRAGFASQARSSDREDGLTLRGAYITAALRCAPPANRPTAAQLERCRPFLVRELELMRPPVALCLGSIAWNAAFAALAETGASVPRPRPRFAHGAEQRLGATTLLGSYHVSQQNTFTGRLTEAMFDRILDRARALLGAGVRS